MRSPFIEISVYGARNKCPSFPSEYACDLFGRKMPLEHLHHRAEQRSFQYADALHRVHPLHMVLPPHFVDIISIFSSVSLDMPIYCAWIFAKRAGNLGACISGSQHTTNDRPILLSN